MKVNQKILIVADPGQGIITPSYRLANCLIKMGVNVTFATSFTGVKNIIDKQTTHPNLTFAPFPDSLDTHENSDTQPTKTSQQVNSEFAASATCAVAEIISSAAANGHPFDNVVYSILVPWAARLAMAHGVKPTLLWCQPAIVFDIYYYYFNGYEELISSARNNSTFPISLPGLPPLTIDDLPSLFWQPRPNENDFLLELVKDHMDVLKVAPSILINTFDKLETESMKLIEKVQFFPIGPLISQEDKISSDNYIQWLNKQPKSSVVYVSFGTRATLSMEQIEEIANALLALRRPFLWIIRDSDQARSLNKINKLQKQGMIVDWCSQGMVLKHQAIGCFLMHGGWNSTMEALVSGVPMVVFPQWSDQGTNGKMVADVWKVGVRVKRREGEGVVDGNKFKRCIEMVIGDDEMTRNTEKWRNSAREALDNGGSLNINLQAFLDDA